MESTLDSLDKENFYFQSLAFCLPGNVTRFLTSALDMAEGVQVWTRVGNADFLGNEENRVNQHARGPGLHRYSPGYGVLFV